MWQKMSSFSLYEDVVPKTNSDLPHVMVNEESCSEFGFTCTSLMQRALVLVKDAPKWFN